MHFPISDLEPNTLEVCCNSHALVQVGVQEKTTFVQTGMALSGSALYSSVIQLAAAIQIFLLLTGILVLFHHAAPPTAPRKQNDSQLLADVLTSSSQDA